jgi:hypothetical protein
VLVRTLMELDPRFPRVTKEQRDALQEVKRELVAQAPKGAAPDPFAARQGEEDAQQAGQRDGSAGQSEGSAGQRDGSAPEDASERRADPVT